MFGTLGGQEIIFILVLALIVFGPRKLPEIGKSIGRMMAEFRKASNDFRRTLEDEVEAEKLRPVETVATAPVDTTSAEVTPADATPAEATPAETSSAASAPADSPAAEGGAGPSEPDVPGVTAPGEPTVARPEPAGVGRPDGRPGE